MSEDEQRVQVQIALWQMLEAEGMKPTTDLVRRIRKLVEDGLKDRDVVLEEAVILARQMMQGHAGKQTCEGEVYKILDAALKERV